MMKRIFTILFLCIVWKVSALETTRYLQIVNTAAGLMTFNPATSVMQTNVYVEGVLTAGDGHAGLLTFYAASSAATNTYNCFKPASGTGRWIRPIQNVSATDVGITNIPSGGTGRLLFGNSSAPTNLKKVVLQQSSFGFSIDFLSDDESTGTNILFFPYAGGVVISSGPIQEKAVIAGAQTVSSNLTLTGSTASQFHTIAGDASSSNIVVTLPPVASSAGRILYISKIDSSTNTVTIKGNASELISGVNLKPISSQWTGYMVQDVEGNYWLVL